MARQHIVLVIGLVIAGLMAWDEVPKIKHDFWGYLWDIAKILLVTFLILILLYILRKR